MIAPNRDVPLARDASNRFLPWIIGLMVFVATLALAATMVLAGVGGKWRAGLTGTLTVQILPGPEGEEPAAFDRRIAEAVRLLQETPGIETVAVVPLEKTASLLEPWLGPGAAANLPLPRLIDVRLAERPRVDTAALAAGLSEAVPGVIVDDHGLWLDRLITFARGLEAVAYLVMGLIGAASVAAVVFTTRTGLSVHREVIELLHLIGAQDSYIASAFQRQALRLGLQGAAAGFLLAVAVLLVIGRLSDRIGDSLLPAVTLAPAQWIALLCLPIAAVLLSTVTARITVLRSIARQP